MYFKGENVRQVLTTTDERVVGKVNLRYGLAALTLAVGLIAVVLFLSYGHPLPAVLCGLAAVVLLVLIITDPTGILQRKTRQDGPDTRRE